MQTKNRLKEFLKSTFLLAWVNSYRNWKESKRVKNEIKRLLERKKNVIKDWEQAGKPAPPPAEYKIATIKNYANKYSLGILIETGTYLGKTVRECLKDFKKIVSIELDQKLFKNATNQFAGERNVAIYQGDSGIVIKQVLSNLSEPCLFWLDGHYSEGVTAKGKFNTPILNELACIFNHAVKNHVILIDDARCFTGQNDYPSIEELRDIVYQANQAYQFVVKDDIIRITIK